ncbi:MAG: type II toxin-antitoxin system prevent-host-death family antitoxin [Fimbriimonas sp.]|nr:type II toxin-antitoxin system prevent-host-death family antitoxin [Fimbriimonas sp.]
MKQISVHEVKAHFSAIMKEVESGEVVVVTRHDKPVIEMRSVVGRPCPQLGAFADSKSPHLEVQWTEEELDELLGAEDGGVRPKT